MLDTPLLVSSAILIAIGCVSIAFSLILHKKSRAIQKITKKLTPNIFHKRFNIFDPYPSRRTIIHSDIITMLPFLIFFAALILTFVVTATIVQAGLLLSATIFILCAALMAFEEAFEIPKNADVFLKAIKEGRGLGQGDLIVFSIVKKTLPKLRNYYFALAIAFFAFSAILHFIMPSVTFAFAWIATLPFELASSWGVLVAFYTTLWLAIITLTIQIVAGRIKNMIFGFPQPESLYTLSKPFELMKQWIHWHPHELYHRPPPEPNGIPEGEKRKE